MSFRLNVPSADESRVLLTVEGWKQVCARDVPERAGRPILAYDVGHSRAWSGAVALWKNGRIEALALAPGIPGIEAQEKRDRTPRGVYRALVENGSLRVAEGLRVPTPAMLHTAALEAFGAPQRILCDRFALGSVKDAVRGVVPVIDRVTRWSDATVDIGALRLMAMDGPLSCVPSSRPLLTASLGAAMVKKRRSRIVQARQARHKQYRPRRHMRRARARVRVAATPAQPTGPPRLSSRARAVNAEEERYLAEGKPAPGAVLRGEARAGGPDIGARVVGSVVARARGPNRSAERGPGHGGPVRDMSRKTSRQPAPCGARSQAVGAATSPNFRKGFLAMRALRESRCAGVRSRGPARKGRRSLRSGEPSKLVPRVPRRKDAHRQRAPSGPGP